jgi:hypothetical protein
VEWGLSPEVADHGNLVIYTSLMTPITEGGERGHDAAVVWNDAPVRAWVPHLLASQEFEVGIRTARHTEQAIAAVRAGGALSARFEPLTLLLLRAEGMASCGSMPALTRDPTTDPDTRRRC